jgi:hypothetical protein
MSTLFSWSRWLGLFGRKSAPAKAGKRPATRKHQQDFADYGTAFGLEMSLSNQAAAEPLDAPAHKTKHDPAIAQEAIAPVR